MNNAFYDSLRKTALASIDKYGMSIVLTRTVKGVQDNNAGTVGASTTTTYNCVGLIEEYDERVVSSSLVRADEKKLLIAAEGLGVKPIVGDQFELPDGIWFIPDGDGFDRIPPVKVLAPGGIDILYTVRIRQ